MAKYTAVNTIVLRRDDEKGISKEFVVKPGEVFTPTADELKDLMASAPESFRKPIQEDTANEAERKRLAAEAEAKAAEDAKKAQDDARAKAKADSEARAAEAANAAKTGAKPASDL